MRFDTDAVTPRETELPPKVEEWLQTNIMRVVRWCYVIRHPILFAKAALARHRTQKAIARYKAEAEKDGVVWLDKRQNAEDN